MKKNIFSLLFYFISTVPCNSVNYFISMCVSQTFHFIICASMFKIYFLLCKRAFSWKLNTLPLITTLQYKEIRCYAHSSQPIEIYPQSNGSNTRYVLWHTLTYLIQVHFLLSNFHWEFQKLSMLCTPITLLIKGTTTFISSSSSFSLALRPFLWNGCPILPF